MDRPTHRLRGLLPAALVGGMLVVITPGLAGAAATTTSGGSGGTALPGAFGTVAAITGTSMEVQNQQTGQVTINWTSTTAFTRDATVPASSVVAGDCATVVGSTSKGRITAITVSIRQASAGSCDAGGPVSAGSSNPSGSGGSGPVRISGASPGGGRLNSGSGAKPPGVASGKVLSVSGSRLVLSGFSSAAVQKTSNKKTGKKASTKAPRSKDRSLKLLRPSKAQIVSVVLSSSTTYTDTEPAAAANLAVGDCVTASGPSASNGSVTANAVQITSTGGKSCTGPGGTGTTFVGGGPTGGGGQVSGG